MSNPGWECPKCGNVYAPWVKRCDQCPKGRESAGRTAGIMICGCPITTDGSQAHNYNCPHFRLSP